MLWNVFILFSVILLKRCFRLDFASILTAMILLNFFSNWSLLFLSISVFGHWQSPLKTGDRIQLSLMNRIFFIRFDRIKRGVDVSVVEFAIFLSQSSTVITPNCRQRSSTAISSYEFGHKLHINLICFSFQLDSRFCSVFGVDVDFVYLTMFCQVLTG